MPTKGLRQEMEADRNRYDDAMRGTSEQALDIVEVPRTAKAL